MPTLDGNETIHEFITRISATKSTQISLKKAFELNPASLTATQNIIDKLCNTLRIGKDIYPRNLVEFLLQFDAYLTKLYQIVDTTKIEKLEKLTLLSASIENGISGSYTDMSNEILIRVSVKHLNDTLRAFTHEYGHRIDFTKRKALEASGISTEYYYKERRNDFISNDTCANLLRLESELKKGEAGKYYMVQGEKTYIMKSHFSYYLNTLEVIARSFDSYIAYLIGLSAYTVDVTDNLVAPKYDEIKEAIEHHYKDYLM